jgi:hypothetical protein
MKRVSIWLFAGGIILATLAYGISFCWPPYEWDLRVPSPDAKYDLIVLRDDVAAFADFGYHIYLFPHEFAPRDRAQGERVWYVPPWRGRKYLVYSGDDVPMFRWTGTHSVEIDIQEVYTQPFILEPVKRFRQSEAPILISVRFGIGDTTNISP